MPPPVAEISQRLNLQPGSPAQTVPVNERFAGIVIDDSPHAILNFMKLVTLHSKP